MIKANHITFRTTAFTVLIAILSGVSLLAASQDDEPLVEKIIYLPNQVRLCIDCKGADRDLFPMSRQLLSKRGSIEVDRQGWIFTITDVNENVESIRRLIEAYHDPESPSSTDSPERERNPDAEVAIRAVLDAQRDAWNRGDIEGYMDGYDRSPNTLFVSGNNVTRGWQTVLDRYKKTYDSREKMGALTFSDLEITLLSKDAALVLGRWRLKRANDEPHGTFTLLFRKTKAGWRIVHDHTSSA